MTLRELNSIIRRKGNADIAEYLKLAENKGKTVEQARRAPLKEVRQMFNLAKMMEEIPEHSGFEPYRVGWRGPYRITHGTTSGYTQGCRCVECKAANTAYCRKRRQEVRAEQEAEELRKYQEGTKLAQEGKVPEMFAGAAVERRIEDDPISDRFAALNKLVCSFESDKPIPNAILKQWASLCGIANAREMTEWYLQAPIEIRGESMYKKRMSNEEIKNESAIS